MGKLILLNKLESHCTPDTINFLKWYFNQIGLRLDDEVIHQNKGSPQGGISSPMLWLVYINDLVDELTKIVGIKNVFVFADDLMILAGSYNVAFSIIRRVRRWSEKNKIKINNKKSAILPLAKKASNKDNFKREVLDIPFTKSYKYLGLVFDYTMDFKETLVKTTRDVSMMKNHMVFGSIGMSLTQKINLWKTYFYSKLLYPLVLLSLMRKTAARRITSKISLSFQEHFFY